MPSYAPVLISVYNRPQHFKNCICSLAKNHGASETPLFIALDAPSREEDVKPNEEIANFAYKIAGFKSVYVFRRENNVGAVTNIRQARKEIFSDHHSLIFSEDDNLFSPYFLEFVNQGLSLYKNDERVFSISGYNYPICIPERFNEDYYISKALSAWGVGYWRDKIEKVDFEVGDFWKNYLNPMELIRLNRSLGDHVFLHSVLSKRKGRITGDTAVCLHLFKNNMYSVFPRVSLVRNMGHDGSGLHCGSRAENIYSSQPIWDFPYPPKIHYTEVKESPEIKKILLKHFKINSFKKTACYLYYLYYVLFLRLRQFLNK